MSNSKKDSFWISYADLMTLLMVVFLLISVSFMALVEDEKEKEETIVSKYQTTKEELFKDLSKTFKNDLKHWDIELNKNLSIQFSNPDVLFPSGDTKLTIRFRIILAEFFPKYLKIITDKKYKDVISEVRIEGHTDDVMLINGWTGDPYIDNIELSQDRARNVLAFLRSLPAYKKLHPKDELRMKFWLTANGLSYGRMLDKNKEFAIKSDNNNVDKEKSRRVEFKILTRSDELVEEIIKQFD